MEECFKLVEKVADEYVPGIVSSIRTNQAAKETLLEICNLLADITDIVNIEIPRSFNPEEAMRSCTLSVLLTVVRPAMDHLFAAYIYGAYPLCYQPIRISTEALAYSLYIDMGGFQPKNDIAPEKLYELQKYLDQNNISVSRLISKHLPNVADGKLEEMMLRIWGKTSNDFLHFKGYMDKILKCMNSDSENAPPSYLVGAFVPYDESDELDLIELKKTVSLENC